MDPNLIKQHMVQTVNKFFDGLLLKVKELEIDVTSRIKESESLKELYRVLDNNKEFFSQAQQPNPFEIEKKNFDE